MKKIINKIKEKDIDIILMLIIIITLITFQYILEAVDEMWNFANVFKMANGYKIYTEINVIVTPIFFYIGKILLCLLGKNYFIFRIYNIIIYLTLFLLIFKLLKQLKMPRRRIIAFIFALCYILKRIILTGANYNILVFIPIIIVLILLIKKCNNPLILATISIITFLIKQNVGIYLSIGICIYYLTSKNNVKEKIKNIVIFSIIFLLETIIFLVSLFINNNLYGFINYAILSMREFGTSNINNEIYALSYLVIVLALDVIQIYLINNKKPNIKQEVKDNIKIFLSIGMPIILMSYPIFNYAHVAVSVLISEIGIAYFINNTIIDELEINAKKEKILYLCFIIILFINITVETISVVKYMNKFYYTKDFNNPYFGVLIKKERYENIEKITKYIKENNSYGIDVKVLSADAGLYTTYLEKNNKNFDLPFLGNLGKYGENGLIEEIKQLRNTKILIKTNEEDVFWQESKKTREYIKNNYIKEGTIEDFDIYRVSN